MERVDLALNAETLAWVPFGDLIGMLRPYVSRQGATGFELDDVIRSALRIEPGTVGRDMRSKVGMALSALEVRRYEQRTRIPRFVYRKPPENV